MEAVKHKSRADQLEIVMEMLAKKHIREPAEESKISERSLGLYETSERKQREKNVTVRQSRNLGDELGLQLQNMSRMRHTDQDIIDAPHFMSNRSGKPEDSRMLDSFMESSQSFEPEDIGVASLVPEIAEKKQTTTEFNMTNKGRVKLRKDIPGALRLNLKKEDSMVSSARTPDFKLAIQSSVSSRANGMIRKVPSGVKVLNTEQAETSRMESTFKVPSQLGIIHKPTPFMLPNSPFLPKYYSNAYAQQHAIKSSHKDIRIDTNEGASSPMSRPSSSLTESKVRPKVSIPGSLLFDK